MEDQIIETIEESGYINLTEVKRPHKKVKEEAK